MTTFHDLAEEVLLTLEGYAGDSSVIGVLADPLTETDTSMAVAVPPDSPDGSSFSAGLVEVGSELVNAIGFDRGSGVFTSVLRGWRGSQAVPHPAGEIVRGNPKYPRHAVQRAVNDAIEKVFPRICAVATVELTASGNQIRYALPAGALSIHQISWEDYGGSLTWVPVRRYSIVNEPGGGLSVDVMGVPSGRRFRVRCFSQPSPLSAPDDDFESVTGLGSYARPAVVAGAVHKLFSSVELGRALTTAVDQSVLNRQSPVGATVQIARQLQEQYLLEMASAENRFQDLYPPTRTVEVW